MIEVKEVLGKQELKDFLAVSHLVHATDPAAVPQIEMDMMQKLDRKKNPFFEHGEGSFFVAYKNGQPVGRITAHTDFLHQEKHKEKAGFFGFFDSIDDQSVVDALMGEVEKWHAARGNTKIMGPFNFNINSEVGVLIDGFETPPFLLMTHNPNYYAKRLEGASFDKAKDLFAWLYTPQGMLNDKTVAMAQAARQIPGLKIRSLDKKNLGEEIKIVMNIFNQAWSRNWGFLPMTEAELDLMAKELKLILDTRLAFVVEIDGKPSAMCIALPNINEALVGLKKPSLPKVLFKALWHLKTRKIKGVRLALLGILPELVMDPRYRGLSVLMYVEIQERTLAAGYTHGELSWTLEDNDPVNHGIQKMGKVDKYKTYRVFQKTVAQLTAH